MVQETNFESSLNSFNVVAGSSFRLRVQLRSKWNSFIFLIPEMCSTPLSYFWNGI